MSERRTEPLGQKGLDEIADRDIHKGLANYGEVLTVKERLLRRSRKKIYRFLLVDGEDEIPLDTRRMTSSEREQAIINYNKIKNMKEEGELTTINEAMKELQKILTNITLDDEMDFTSGEEWITDEDVVDLVSMAIQASWKDSGAEIKSFQPNTDRPDNT